MPDSRKPRVWITTLVALVALLAFAPQAGAEYDESDEPVEGCVAHDSDYEDSCSDDEPKDEQEGEDGESGDQPDGCFARGDHDEWCSDDPKDEPEHCFARGDYTDWCSEDEPKDEPEVDEPKDEADHTQSCDDGPVAESAHRSRKREAKFEDGCLPHFVRRFISRVWKFVGEVDYYEEGVLSMTMHKILNLPRKWRTQDDELIDGDATVLVSQRVRVFQDGERVGRDALEAANDVRVHGKLLRPFKWLEDEDGETVPTIRAKKVYITG